MDKRLKITGVSQNPVTETSILTFLDGTVANVPAWALIDLKGKYGHTGIVDTALTATSGKVIPFRHKGWGRFAFDA